MSVYFAKVGRYIKVGFSDHPERRVANLWRSSSRYNRPWDLELEEPRLLLAIDGDLDTEAACHDALNDYWAGREWFVDEPGVREFMAHAAAGEFPKVERPGGQFRPVDSSAASESRLAELDLMVAHRKGKPSVDFGGGDVLGGAA